MLVIRPSIGGASGGLPITAEFRDSEVSMRRRNGSPLWINSNDDRGVIAGRAAIDRLPGQSNAAITRVLENARALSAQAVIDACQTELATRGSLQLSGEQAQQAVTAQMRVKDKGLREVIEIAFQEVPLYPEEAWVIRKLTANPGIRYANFESSYVAQFRKNDLSLVVGHLVYDRFGYFRHLIQSKTLSDLLIERGNDGGLTYRLRSETLDAFRALDVVS